MEHPSLAVLVNQVVMDLAEVVGEVAFVAGRPDLADKVLNILETHADSAALILADLNGEL